MQPIIAADSHLLIPNIHDSVLTKVEHLDHCTRLRFQPQLEGPICLSISHPKGGFIYGVGIIMPGIVSAVYARLESANSTWLGGIAGHALSDQVFANLSVYGPVGWMVWVELLYGDAFAVAGDGSLSESDIWAGPPG